LRASGVTREQDPGWIRSADGSIHTTYVNPETGPYSAMQYATEARTGVAMQPSAKRLRPDVPTWA
jgi:hypothetical protein